MVENFVETSEVCIYLVQCGMAEMTAGFLEDFMLSHALSGALNLLVRHNNHCRQKLLLI